MDAKSETKNITNWCATHITQQTVSFTLLPITLLQLLLRVTRLSIESHLDPLCIKDLVGIWKGFGRVLVQFWYSSDSIGIW